MLVASDQYLKLHSFNSLSVKINKLPNMYSQKGTNFRPARLTQGIPMSFYGTPVCSLYSLHNYM